MWELEGREKPLESDQIRESGFFGQKKRENLDQNPTPRRSLTFLVMDPAKIRTKVECGS